MSIVDKQPVTQTAAIAQPTSSDEIVAESTWRKQNTHTLTRPESTHHTLWSTLTPPTSTLISGEPTDTQMKVSISTSQYVLSAVGNPILVIIL